MCARILRMSKTQHRRMAEPKFVGFKDIFTRESAESASTLSAWRLSEPPVADKP